MAMLVGLPDAVGCAPIDGRIKGCEASQRNKPSGADACPGSLVRKLSKLFGLLQRRGKWLHGVLAYAVAVETPAGSRSIGPLLPTRQARKSLGGRSRPPVRKGTADESAARAKYSRVSGGLKVTDARCRAADVQQDSNAMHFASKVGAGTLRLVAPAAEGPAKCSDR